MHTTELPPLSSRSEYLTIRGASQRLGITRESVERLIADGTLRAVLMPGCWSRIVAADVDALVRRYRGDVAAS